MIKREGSVSSGAEVRLSIRSLDVNYINSSISILHKLIE